MFHLFSPSRIYSPSSSNSARAKIAAIGLRAYNKAVGSLGRAEDVENELVDFVSGLLHLSETMGLKPWSVLKKATEKYDVESGRAGAKR